MAGLPYLSYPKRPPILKELRNEGCTPMGAVESVLCAFDAHVAEAGCAREVAEGHDIAVGWVHCQRPALVLAVAAHLHRPLCLVVLVVVREEGVRWPP